MCTAVTEVKEQRIFPTFVYLHAQVSVEMHRVKLLRYCIKHDMKP